MVEGFRILRELGRGAASVIYAVHDPKTKQVWALKHVEKDDEKSIRFLDQAEREYHIARIVASDKVRRIEKIIKKKESILGGVNDLYLVMEFVDGASCERNPPQTFVEALLIFEQVAEGLASMHAKGYVHADMKPNNVIVDDKDNAKIIDLGQSCKIGTIKQRIQGTPDYIAPEQVHRRAITPKTDVYNLGASLYWILTRSFIPTALAKSTSLLGSVDDALLQKPKRPSEINPRVPEILDALIMACVEVDADKRPTMEQVHDRINLARAKLVAEAQLRKSGSLPRIDPTAGAPGNNGTSSSSGSASTGGSKSGSTAAIFPDLGGTGGTKGPGGSSGVSVGNSREPRKSEPPPIDPGPGIAPADD